jgi:hypothetical protein
VACRVPNVGAAISAAALLLFCGAPHAMEAPNPQPQPDAAPPPARAEVTPTDETQFYELLQRVSSSRTLRGLGVSQDTITELGRGHIDVAVASLGTLASQGNREANIALVRIQHFCGRVTSARPVDPKTQLANLPELPADRAARVAGVIRAESEWMARARAACVKAPFDYRGIEARLREAASAGHAASATELAQYTRDPAKKKALLQSAIDKNYPPAMYAVATELLIAVQRGETTENVGAIRELLKQAGRSVTKAKLDLANCMAFGCDGHPADTATAQAFGVDAARDGEPTAFVAMVRMPWGGNMTRTQLLAWQYFGDRLNEAGCMGDTYIPSTAGFMQMIQLLEKGQPPDALAGARTLAEDLWRDNSARAKKENNCG